jgi:hypothetical protein
MLGGIALAALIIGSVSSAVVVSQDQPAQNDTSKTPVVEVQKVETANPFSE